MTKQWNVDSTTSDAPVKVIAKSIFRELSQAGYSPAQIVTLSTELIDLVTSHLREGHRLRARHLSLQRLR